MDEKALLEKMQKAFGVEVDFTAIEEKHARKRKEDALLAQLNESFNILINKNQDKAEIIEQEIIETIEVLAETVPEPIIEEPIIEEAPVVMEDAPGTAGRQPEPELPKKDIINRSVEALSKVSQKDIQKAADELPDGIRKELDIIKKSIADFHRFAQRHSQMGGGGEVKLARLDDVNSTTVMDGLYLRYDAASKMFVFDNPLSGELGQQQSDWNEANTYAVDYIKNKPPITVDANNNVEFAASVVPNDGTYALGTAAQPWNNVYIGPHSLTIVPDQPNGTPIIIENLNDLLNVTAGGFAVRDITNSFDTLQIDPGGYTVHRSKDTTSIPIQILGDLQASVLGTYPYPGTIIEGVGQTNTACFISITAYSDVYNLGTAFIGKRSRGSATNPTAVQAGDEITGIVGRGWDGNGFPAAAASYLGIYAAENFTTNNHGTYARFGLVPPGTSASVPVIDFLYNGLKLYSPNTTSVYTKIGRAHV